jgi:hypothetical protein
VWVVISLIIFFIGDINEPKLFERLGTAYNILGIYFIFRALIRNIGDIVRAIKYLSIIILPLAILFAVEYVTGRNPFSVFGGVPDFTTIRDGKLRCQGPFRHPILAGTFGSTAMPLFVWLWCFNARYRWLATGAIVAATFIVIASSSSGPLIAYFVGVVGLLFWPFRSDMRIVRWGILLSMLILHMIMKAPVWFLIARIGNLIGGGGWHRAALIDAAINHFSEWWLFGTAYTAHWMPTGIAIDPNNTDITNQFVAECVNGGIVRLLLFVCLIVGCFKTIGVAVKNTAKKSFPERFIIWSVGCVLVGHLASFFSVTYFDQIIIFFYFIVAIIASFNELYVSSSKFHIRFTKSPSLLQMGRPIRKKQKQ